MLRDQIFGNFTMGAIFRLACMSLDLLDDSLLVDTMV